MMFGRQYRRSGFTLVELLVVIAVGSIISSMVAIALNGASTQAKAERTRNQTERIGLLTLQLYEQASTRQVGAPVGDRIPRTSNLFYQNNQTNEAASNSRQLAILNWKRDYLRCAMPDSIADLRDNPVPISYLRVERVVTGNGTNFTFLPERIDNVPGSSPNDPPQINTSISTLRTVAQDRIRTRALQLVRRHNGDQSITLLQMLGPDVATDGFWTKEHQAAECLYLIMATAILNNRPAIDALQSREISDTDDDGIPEIIDGYGQPLGYMRWPAGFYLHQDYLTVADLSNNPEIDRRPAGFSEDPLDILRVDPRLQDDGTPAALADDTYLILPVIVSAGSDGIFDLRGLDTPTTYRYGEQTTMSAMPNFVSNRFRHTLGFDPNARFIDPFTQDRSTTIRSFQRFGTPRDDNGDEEDNTGDNIYSPLVTQ